MAVRWRDEVRDPTTAIVGAGDWTSAAEGERRQLKAGVESLTRLDRQTSMRGGGLRVVMSQTACEERRARAVLSRPRQERRSVSSGGGSDDDDDDEDGSQSPRRREAIDCVRATRDERAREERMTRSATGEKRTASEAAAAAAAAQQLRTRFPWNTKSKLLPPFCRRASCAHS